MMQKLWSIVLVCGMGMFFPLQVFGFGSGLTGCASPVQPVTLSNPAVITDCSQAGIQAALNIGGHITFNCGSAPTTIPINSQLNFNPKVSTVLDGKGLITLDGKHKTRILYKGWHDFSTFGYVTIVLQNIRVIRGKAPSASTTTDHSGGAINVGYHGTKVYIINSTFENNVTTDVHTPDNQGGAIFVHHCYETVLSGTTFSSNSAGNGGALGGIASGLFIFNSRFTSNHALDDAAGDVVRGHGGAVHLDGVTNSYNPDSNKRVYVCGSVLEGNTAVRGGGALKVTVSDKKGTKATYEKSSFTNNQVSGTSGVEGLGGAIYHIEDDHAGGQDELNVEVIDSTFTGNQANKQGGGAWISVLGRVEVTDSTFSNNHATDSTSDITLGGGLRIGSTTALVSGSTFSGNQAYDTGGGMWLSVSGTADIRNSTFTANRANDPASGMGGGLTITNGAVTITNATFARNYAWFHGGGIQTGTNPVVTLTNTLFYYNESERDWGNYQMNLQADIDGGGNLQFPKQRFNQSPPTDDGKVTPSVIIADPLLQVLGDNGGPTATMALQTGSAAINIRTDGVCPSTDQRGFLRTDGACDAGAYEYGAGCSYLLWTR